VCVGHHCHRVGCTLDRYRYSWCLACLDLVHGFIDLSDRRREGISVGESGVDACASDTTTRASGGDCVGRFNKVLKCSCHLAATDALPDSSFPSSAVNRADEVAHFCSSCRNEAKEKHIVVFFLIKRVRAFYPQAQYVCVKVEPQYDG